MAMYSSRRFRIYLWRSFSIVFICDLFVSRDDPLMS